METSKFIQMVADGESINASDAISELINNKAMEALEYYKQEIATSMFGGMATEEVEE